MDYRLQQNTIRCMTNLRINEAGLIFGGVIKKHRQRLGISQEELAHRADVDRTFVSRLERGVRQPTITTLIQLAKALEVTAAELVGEVEAGL